MILVSLLLGCLAAPLLLIRFAPSPTEAGAQEWADPWAADVALTGRDASGRDVAFVSDGMTRQDRPLHRAA